MDYNIFCLCGEQEIEAMDADDILARQVEQLDKEKKELQIRLKTQEKKVKFICTVTDSSEFFFFYLSVLPL